MRFFGWFGSKLVTVTPDSDDEYEVKPDPARLVKNIYKKFTGQLQVLYYLFTAEDLYYSKPIYSNTS